MKFQYNDGGRELAGFKGKTRDCYDCSRNETRCVYGYWTK